MPNWQFSTTRSVVGFICSHCAPVAGLARCRRSNLATSILDGASCISPSPGAAPNALSIFRSLGKWSCALFGLCVSGVRCIPRRPQNGYFPLTAHQDTPYRAKVRSSHTVEVGQRSSSELPYDRDCRGVSEFDAKLLMNRAIPGVNAGYITRHKLLEDHLRSQQQAISIAIFAVVGRSLNEHSGIRNWLGRNGPQRLALVADIKKDYCQRPIVEPRDCEAA